MTNVEMTYAGAIRSSLAEEMRRDQDVFLIGEEIGVYGGALKVTVGLLDEFGPERVMDTPISEVAIVGLAVGAAIMGMRPVAEIMYMDFVQLAMEQLVTQAARARFVSGGKLKVPVVIRTQYSLGRGTGPQHSQFFPSWFFQAPGMKVVLPSTPADAKGLLKASVRDDNPVLFIECAGLYRTKGLVPEGDYVTNLGEATIRRQGSDVTIVAVSRVVQEAMLAAEELSRRAIEAEVIDPRTLQPLDVKTLINSVRKTQHLLIAADDLPVGGAGAGIVSAILPDVFYHLEAPIKILGPPNFPAPANIGLEQQYLVDKEDITRAARSLFQET